MLFVQDPELEVEPISSLKDSSKASSAIPRDIPRGPNVTAQQRPASTGTLEFLKW